MLRNILFLIIGAILLISIPVAEIYLDNFMAYSAVDQVNDVDDSRWLLRYNDFIPYLLVFLKVVGYTLILIPLYQVYKERKK